MKKHTPIFLITLLCSTLIAKNHVITKTEICELKSILCCRGNNVYIEFVDNIKDCKDKKSLTKEFNRQNSIEIINAPESKIEITESFPYELIDFKENNIVSKKKEIEKLIEKIQNLMQKQTIESASAQLLNNPEWKIPGCSLFIINSSGLCSADSDLNNLMWNEINKEDKELIQKGSYNGDWIIHSWHSDPRLSFVKAIDKDNEKYFVGCGFHIDDPALRAHELMKKIASESKIEEIIQQINSNNLSLIKSQSAPTITIIDSNGIIFADTRSNEVIGNSLLDYKDDDGKALYKIAIENAKTDESQSFVSKSNTFERNICMQKFIDKNSKYIVLISFIQNISSKELESFLIKAAHHMQEHSLEKALNDFKNRTHGSFSTDSLAVTIIDEKGVILMDPLNINLIGKNIENPEAEFAGLDLSLFRKNDAFQDNEGCSSFIGKNGYTQICWKSTRNKNGNFILASKKYPYSRKDISESIAKNLASKKSIDAIKNKINTEAEKIIPGGIFTEYYLNDGSNLVRNYKNKQLDSIIDKSWETILKTSNDGGGFLIKDEGSYFVQPVEHFNHKKQKKAATKKIDGGRLIKSYGEVPVIKKAAEEEAYQDLGMVISWYNS